MADELDELKARAEKGDAEAHYQLGVRLSKGEGVAQDYRAALEHFEVAAVGAGLGKPRNAFRSEAWKVIWSLTKQDSTPRAPLR
jgi:hypothetical protein